MSKSALLLLVVLSLSAAQTTYYFESILSSYYVECEHGGEGHDFGYNLRRSVLHACQPDGYCDRAFPQFPINNQASCEGPSENIGWRFAFEFYNPTEANFEFQFGTDFGYGGALFVDGDYHSSKAYDLWWNGNWDDSGVIYVSVDLDVGYHDLVYFGAEQCCDGLMDFRFKKDGDGWHSFNVFPEYIGYNPNTCPEDTPVSCDQVTIFSECCYGGMSMVITEDNGECLDWSPYSICIPRGYKATFYDLCQFEGQSATFTSSVSCLDDINFNMLANFGIHIGGKTKLKLHRNQPDHKITPRFEITKLE